MPSPDPSNVSPSRPLARALVTLAGTPTDAPDVDAQLALIAGLAVDRVAAVAYASITGERGEQHTTVAAGGDLARSVDQALDGAGRVSGDGKPTRVPLKAAMMRWPRFRDEAFDLGLRASVSLPLYDGTAGAVAVLDLYGHDHDAMAPVIVAVWSVYDPHRPLPDDSAELPALEPGAVELVDGFAEVLVVRGTILTALSMIMASRRCDPGHAGVILRLRAAAAGTDLAAAAAALIAESV